MSPCPSSFGLDRRRMGRLEWAERLESENRCSPTAVPADTPGCGCRSSAGEEKEIPFVVPSLSGGFLSERARSEACLDQEGLRLAAAATARSHSSRTSASGSTLRLKHSGQLLVIAHRWERQLSRFRSVVLRSMNQRIVGVSFISVACKNCQRNVGRHEDGSIMHWRLFLLAILTHGSGLCLLLAAIGLQNSSVSEI